MSEQPEDKYIRYNILELRSQHPKKFGRYIMALKNLINSDDWAQANFMEGNEIPRYCHIIQWKAQRDEKPSEYLGNFLNYLDDILQKFLEKNYEVGINAVREAKTLFIKHNLTSCVQCEKPFCLKN